MIRGNLSAEAQNCSQHGGIGTPADLPAPARAKRFPRLTAFKVHNNFIPWVLFTYEDTELVSSWQVTQQSQIRVSVAAKPELCRKDKPQGQVAGLWGRTFWVRAPGTQCLREEVSCV